MALTAAGTAASAAGQKRAQKAMDGAREAERIRQKGFEDQSTAVLEGSMTNADKANQDQYEAGALSKRKSDAEAATADVRAPIEASGQNLAGDQSANVLIDTERAAQGAKALNFANLQGGAKAKILSFSDLNFNNAINNARALQDQGLIANSARGSAALLPGDLEAASRKGQSLRTLGTLLQAAGTVTGIGAGAGWWGASAPAAGAGTIGTAAGAEGARLMGTTSADLALRGAPTGYNFGQLSAGMQDPLAFSKFMQAPVYSTPYSIVPAGGGFTLR